MRARGCNKSWVVKRKFDSGTGLAPDADAADAADAAAAAAAAAATPATPQDQGAAAASGWEEPPQAPSPGGRIGGSKGWAGGGGKKASGKA